MRGNPIIRPASTHPYHRSGPITDPRPERTEADAEQRRQSNAVEQARPSSPAPSTQALEGLLAAELADLLWSRQKPGLGQPPSMSPRVGAQSSEIWRDQLLAEIEDLAGGLKRKVTQYALLRAAQSSDEVTAPANEAAVAWLHETLEDIAATALGMEIATRKVFLRAGLAEEQDNGPAA